MLRPENGGIRRNESHTPLLDSSDIQDEHEEGYRHDAFECPSTFSNQQDQGLQPEEEATLKEIAEHLQVPLCATSNTSETGFCPCPQLEPNSGRRNLKPSVGCLIEKSVCQQFPKPPADLDQNLQQHLMTVQNTVLNELMRLNPVLNESVMKDVINCYHCQTFKHLHHLLQKISSTQNHFVLMKWGLKTFLSRELLGHPNLQKLDPIEKVDLLLWTEWGEKAKLNLFENVKKEVRDSLDNILQNEKTQERCDNEEDYVKLYVDIIQCIDAMSKTAQQISSRLSDDVREVCFQELLKFVQKYISEQTEVLGRKAKMDQTETIHFFKTLKTCKELKEHVQTKGSGTSNFEETVETLDKMEAFTLKLLMEIVTNIAETNLKKYFKSHNRLPELFATIKNHFPKLCYGLDEQKRVMDEAYKLIVRIYVKHLIKTKRSKLERCWGSNVGQIVSEDAEELHNTISDLAPDVPKRNDMLLKIQELLECECNEALKVTAADMQNNFLTNSEDTELLPALLKWKGLPKCKVKEVLHAVHYPDHDPNTTSGSWSLFLVCCKS